MGEGEVEPMVYRKLFKLFSNKKILFLVPKGIHSIETLGEIIKKYIENNSFNSNVIVDSLYDLGKIKNIIKDINILCIHAPLQETCAFMDAIQSILDKRDKTTIVLFPVWEEDLYSFYKEKKHVNKDEKFHSIKCLTNLYKDDFVDYVGLYSYILYEQVFRLFRNQNKHFYMDFEEFHFKSIKTSFSDQEEFNILYNFAGIDFWRKNPLGLIEACNIAFNNYDKINIILKTSKLTQEHKELITKASKHKVNIINEFLEERALERLYKIADVYASPHVYEGFGLTIIEAIKYGKKVIASYYGGYADYLSGTFEEIFYVKTKKSKFGRINPPLHEESIVYYPNLEHFANILAYLYMRKFGIYIFGNSRVANMVKEYADLYNIKINGFITDNEPNTLRPKDAKPYIKTIISLSSIPTINRIKSHIPNSLSYYEFFRLLKSML